MDPRMEKAQHLLWETTRLQQAGDLAAAIPKLTEMAGLHAQRAVDLLKAGDADGWIDLYAAITAWGDAHQWANARQLLTSALTFLPNFPEGKGNIEHELGRLRDWLTDAERATGDNGRPSALPPSTVLPMHSPSTSR